MNQWKIKEVDGDRVWHKDSKAAVEDALEEFGDVMDLEVESPNGEERANITEDGTVVLQGGKSEAKTEPVEAEPVETMDDTGNGTNPTATGTDVSEPVPAQMPVDTDPLDILPDYMIDKVQGKPTLNKRGLSVLAFHYGITVTDREILVSPHESDWEYAIVETTIENADGNTFVGTGTAHVDRGDDKDVLLELAETRSYKRAVSFGTGTGIVS